MPSHAFRRAFQSWCLGVILNILVAAFSGFNEYRHWGKSEQTFEEVYNELFGLATVGKKTYNATNKSLLDWGRACHYC